VIFESQKGEKNQGALHRNYFQNWLVIYHLMPGCSSKCVVDATHAQKVKDSLTYEKK
jgi:hypothetical protein